MTSKTSCFLLFVDVYRISRTCTLVCTGRKVIQKVIFAIFSKSNKWIFLMSSRHEPQLHVLVPCFQEVCFSVEADCFFSLE